MRALAVLSAMLMPAVAATGIQVVAMPGQSPLVTFRIVFLTGAAHDPAAKPGLANLTAAMLAGGGTRELAYQQIVDAMFPMAAHVSSQVDKEMTAFSAATHIDNLEAFYKLFRAMLLEPGWRQEDLDRLRDETINFLRVNLRGNNDEELGKEALYQQIYAGGPYAHHNAGSVAALKTIRVGDLKEFYRSRYTQANLVIGIAGGYPAAFPERLKKDFTELPQGARSETTVPPPGEQRGIRMTMIEKPTRSVAYSIGFPIEVKRGHPDYPALLVAQSYLGQHRMSGGRLYERLRQARGLNYGDYAYIEYFPRGMFQFEPDPNLARHRQIFQIWIRPVEPPTAHFALRLALYELNRLVERGLSEEEFQRTRSFLSKYVNLLMKTKRAELGYAIDSLFYGIPGYSAYVRAGLAKLRLEDVNAAIRKHLHPANLDFVVVGQNMEALRAKLLAGEPSPMTYNSPKPDEILKEDRTVERWQIDLKPEDVKIVPVDRIFE